MSQSINARRQQENDGIPPGPPGISMFGNLLQFCKARHDSAQLFQWISIHFLTKKKGLIPCQLSSLSQYGEMTTLHLGSKTWVLPNSDRVISEIIAKRGAITSERPFLPIASGLVSRDKRTVLRQTAQWAEGRRAIHHLNGAALKTYGEWQELESAQLLAAYLLQPALWHKHRFHYSNSVMH